MARAWARVSPRARCIVGGILGAGSGVAYGAAWFTAFERAIAPSDCSFGCLVIIPLTLAAMTALSGIGAVVAYRWRPAFAGGLSALLALLAAAVVAPDVAALPVRLSWRAPNAWDLPLVILGMCTQIVVAFLLGVGAARLLRRRASDA